MINSKAKELDMESVKNWARKKDLDEEIKSQLPRLSFSEIEDNLRSIMENVSKFKKSLPSYFNELVPIGYLYEFANISAMRISKNSKQLKKHTKKILTNIFSRKEGDIIIYRANMEKDDESYLLGKKFAKLDIELIEAGNAPIYLLKYYKGEIKF